MRRRVKLVKQIDEEVRFACAGGIGILREEVWMNSAHEVVRYNLAFVLPHVRYADGGRVLGFDNAHGVHERHWKGKVEHVGYINYPTTARRFYQEVEDLRRDYENEDFPRRI